MGMMLKMTTLLMVLLPLAVWGQKNPPATDLTPVQYQQMLDSLDAVQIVDVRTPMEYKNGHIEGAINISYIGFRFRKKAIKLDPGKPIFIYCQTAHRSPLAAKVLASFGFTNIYDLEEGFNAWQEAGLPVHVPGDE